jgi:hypothetical protein
MTLKPGDHRAEPIARAKMSTRGRRVSLHDFWGGHLAHLFCSDPTSGKKVSKVRGCEKKFMFYPRFPWHSVEVLGPDEHGMLFQNQISDNQDNAQ